MRIYGNRKEQNGMEEQQDMMMRMLELTAQGYACSQILNDRYFEYAAV